jgi:hypothetical protein
MGDWDRKRKCCQ